MAEDDAVEAKLFAMFAAETDGRRIMVACDPNPAPSRHHRRKLRPRGIVQIFSGAAVIEAVAEADDDFGPLAGDHFGKPRKRFARFVGRGQATFAAGDAFRLAEMQVGDDERERLRQPKCALRQSNERDAAECPFVVWH